MDPGKSEEKKDDTGGDNQIESKEELMKKGAVGRRFAVVDIPKEVVEGAETK
jgi:hypothetical protein